jgi:peroxiredoxin
MESGSLAILKKTEGVMKMILLQRMLCGVLLSAVLSMTALAQESALTAERNALLSKLQSMGHGYYPQSDWQALFAQMDQMVEKARAAEAWNDLVEVNMIKAMVYSDMLNDQAAALKVLEETRAAYGAKGVKSMPKVYVREAEVYSKLGDEEAIRQLIKSFKASPYYDPENYAFSGGQGREVPLAVTRANARGSDSISVTAMEMYRKRARYAPGHAFPAFQGSDPSGYTINLADYRGRVVLIDFWAESWAPWRSNLSVLQSAYKEFKSDGFDIIGICIAPDKNGATAFAKANGMDWPIVVSDGGLANRMEIFGEATSFLIDRNGMIIGRDLQGGDLLAAIRQALGR